MTKYLNRRLPPPPVSWDSSSKDAWNRLTASLESALRADNSNRNGIVFTVQGTVSAPSAVVTVNTTSGTLADLYRIVAYLVTELDRQNIVSRK